MSRICDFKGAIQSVCVDTNGAVWLAGRGLHRLDQTNATVNALLADSLDEVRKAYCDPAGVFWLATHGGLTRLVDGAMSFYPKAQGPSGFVSAILKDRQGELWIGTYSGLNRFVDGKFVGEGDPEEQSYRIYALFEDREGTLWVGSEEGLRRLTSRGFRTYTKRDGLKLNTCIRLRQP